jgi:hypothetical protein
VEAEFFHEDRRTDRLDKVKSQFPQLCETSEKRIPKYNFYIRIICLASRWQNVASVQLLTFCTHTSFFISLRNSGVSHATFSLTQVMVSIASDQIGLGRIRLC